MERRRSRRLSRNRPTRVTGRRAGREEARRSLKKLKEEEEEENEGGWEKEGKSRNGRIVEKLHPAHCIELREKERGAARETKEQGWWRAVWMSRGRREGARQDEGDERVGEEGGGGGCGAARRGAFLESSGRRK